MNITIPELSLVVLIGVSGSGKSTFARTHFKPTEVLSSDTCRALVSDDENNQSATTDAFDLLHYIAGKRLKRGLLTVVDATNVQPEARKPLLAIAREYHTLPVAIVLDLPERICHERNQARPDRDFGPHVIRRQSQQLHRSLRGLQREGFRNVITITSPEQLAEVTITRQRLWNNRSEDHGPFDIIGDVHGCFNELCALLGELGYSIEAAPGTSHGYIVHQPAGRKAVFVGDLVDRGPNTPGVLRLVMSMVAAGAALCVPGNHDIKLLRKLRGKNVQITHGLAESLEQLEREPADFKDQVASFIDGLVSHYILDDRKLVVAHAGMKEELQGHASGRVREFALYGETSGETDEFGLPIRYNWAAEYRGGATVVYGHTPVPTPEWLNNTINIDTGCVFGGSLTALRYPERELISVPSNDTYAVPMRPFLPEPESTSTLSAQQQHDDLLRLDDIVGKRLITTRLHRTVMVREAQALAAMEVVSRFAVAPQWLIYLPPTMSPSETSHAPGLLEHPAEALGYYQKHGVAQAICEEKHMGSRAVVVVCRDEEAARRRFGVRSGGIGVCYTRTGRRFFDDIPLEQAFLDTIARAFDGSGLWAELNTDWACLDAELMPWSMKAQGLLRQQYAAVGSASQAALGSALGALEQAQLGGADVTELLERTQDRAALAAHYTRAYRHYCWPVRSLADVRLAPFHLLATEGAVHTDKSHIWHMQTLARLCAGDERGMLMSTPYQVVELADEASVGRAIGWWEELTSRGGEGMVVKPLDFIATDERGMLQPAIKCRGPEYLRIIYGPEYSLHLERLRARGLATKRSLALREFALGVEGLERFVRRDPLRLVHECAFGVLALESEPVDPRL